MSWREFRRTSGKKVWYWKIAQSGESYTTEHGQLGTDSPQNFSDTPGPKGKENTKAYVNAVDNCTFHVNREIRKKEEKGYIEYIDGKPVRDEVTEIDFNKQLPKNFCSYKPQTSITESALLKIHKAGRARYTRKYDGHQHICCHHIWGWEVYSRRMDLITDKFPKHIEALKKLSYGPGTIFAGEMVCWGKSNPAIESLKDISRFSESDPPEARKLVEDNEINEPTFLIFDILFHNKKDLKNTCYDDRRDLYRHEIKKVDRLLISKVTQFDVTPETWEQRAKDEKWEGFVITDGASKPRDKFYSFDGDAKRPKGHSKLKPVDPDDCVVYAAIYGHGKRLNTIGSVLMKQIHPETGEWFRCGKCGSGFEESDVAEMHALLEKHNLPIYKKEKEDKDELDDKGIVIMIEYGGRYPKTNKFRFPVYMGLHPDKTPKECIAQKLAEEE